MGSVSTSATNMVNALNSFGNAVNTALNNRITNAQIGAVNGVATLSSGGTVPLTQMYPTTRQAVAQGATGPAGPNVCDFHHYSPGKPVAGQPSLAMTVTRPFTVPANFAGSHVAMGVPPLSGNVAFTVYKNSTQIGTLTFNPLAGEATFSGVSATTFNIGDRLVIFAPNTGLDSYLTDITYSILGTAI